MRFFLLWLGRYWIVIPIMTIAIAILISSFDFGTVEEGASEASTWSIFIPCLMIVLGAAVYGTKAAGDGAKYVTRIVAVVALIVVAIVALLGVEGSGTLGTFIRQSANGLVTGQVDGKGIGNPTFLVWLIGGIVGTVLLYGIVKALLKSPEKIIMPLVWLILVGGGLYWVATSGMLEDLRSARSTDQLNTRVVQESALEVSRQNLPPRVVYIRAGETRTVQVGHTRPVTFKVPQGGWCINIASPDSFVVLENTSIQTTIEAAGDSVRATVRSYPDWHDVCNS